MSTRSPEVLVVLGCRLHRALPSPALLRRLRTACAAHARSPELPVVFSGGRIWQGTTEAEAMGAWWADHAPHANTTTIVLERQSWNTRQNALSVARICRERDWRSVQLVTCDYHMPRSLRLFEAEGLLVSPLPATHQRRLLVQLRLSSREWGARALDRWRDLRR